MADTNFQGSEFTKLFDSWIDTANKFWKDIEKSRDDTLKWGDINLSFSAVDDSDDEKHRAYKAWETSINNFSAFLKIMAAPEKSRGHGKKLNFICGSAIPGRGGII